MSIIRAIKRWTGADLKYYEKAKAGELKHQFCPHCGEWVPRKFRVTSGILPETDLGNMKVHCPNCERTTVMEIIADGSER